MTQYIVYGVVILLTVLAYFTPKVEIGLSWLAGLGLILVGFPLWTSSHIISILTVAFGVYTIARGHNA